MLVRTILEEKGSAVVTVPAGASAAEAVELLERHGIGALVVLGDPLAPGLGAADIAGMLSERDLVRAMASRGGRALEASVADLMTSVVHTCGLGDTVDDLMAVMTDRRIRHLPVVESGALVGLVSIGDVVKRRVQELQVEAQTLHEYLETGR